VWGQIASLVDSELLTGTSAVEAFLPSFPLSLNRTDDAAHF